MTTMDRIKDIIIATLILIGFSTAISALIVLISNITHVIK